MNRNTHKLTQTHICLNMHGDLQLMDNETVAHGECDVGGRTVASSVIRSSLVDFWSPQSERNLTSHTQTNLISRLINRSCEFTLLFHIRCSSLPFTSCSPHRFGTISYSLCLFFHHCSRRFSLIYPVMPLSSGWYVLSQGLFLGIDPL